MASDIKPEQILAGAGVVAIGAGLYMLLRKRPPTKGPGDEVAAKIGFMARGESGGFQIGFSLAASPRGPILGTWFTDEFLDLESVWKSYEYTVVGTLPDDIHGGENGMVDALVFIRFNGFGLAEEWHDGVYRIQEVKP